MPLSELQADILEALYAAWIENVEEPKRFVGMQGGDLVIMQPGGEHYVLRLIPATVGVPVA